MRVLRVKDIIRKDVPIYYRLLYTGVAVVELKTDPVDYRIDFAIEVKPTGFTEITVSFLDKVDYPLLPVIKELKTIIENMYTSGVLPD